MGQVQACGGKQQRWRGGILAAREDIDGDRGRMDALIEGFAAGGLDSLPAVVPHAGQDLDHLAVAIVAALELRRIAAMACGRTRSLNGAPLSAPGLRARTGP
jgi:hypothetical protein